MRTGPSTTNPGWFQRITPRAFLAALPAKLLAFNLSLRKNSYKDPCGVLVPPFRTALTTVPLLWPYCASYVCVWTVTSSTESGEGTKPT
jgi:hypothetical protein